MACSGLCLLVVLERKHPCACAAGMLGVQRVAEPHLGMATTSLGLYFRGFPLVSGPRTQVAI